MSYFSSVHVFKLCLLILTPKVKSDLCSRNASNADGTAPRNSCVHWTLAAMPSSLVATVPVSRSEWPPRNLVALDMDRSQPKSRGFCKGREEGQVCQLQEIP